MQVVVHCDARVGRHPYSVHHLLPISPRMHIDLDQDLLIRTERQSFMSLLWDDVNACEIHPDSASSATHRRQFFRSMFACIEGAIWLFKQESLQQHQNGSIVFTTSELSILTEIVPGIDSRGLIQEVPANLRFIPNLLFAFRCHARAFEYEPVLRIGDHQWGDLKSSVQVRNRLMHPKELGSLNVSGEEIRRAKGALKWFGLTCSVAHLGGSMWYAAKALQKVEDPEDRAARLQMLLAEADKLKQVILGCV